MQVFQVLQRQDKQTHLELLTGHWVFWGAIIDGNDGLIIFVVNKILRGSSLENSN